MHIKIIYIFQIYKDYSNGFCISCHYSCKSCTGTTKNDCTSCINDSAAIIYNRVFDFVSKSCKCLAGFYDNN